jgi:V-type ATPase 116kDa subunit family
LERRCRFLRNELEKRDVYITDVIQNYRGTIDSLDSEIDEETGYFEEILRNLNNVERNDVELRELLAVLETVEFFFSHAKAVDPRNEEIVVDEGVGLGEEGEDERSSSFICGLISTRVFPVFERVLW